MKNLIFAFLVVSQMASAAVLEESTKVKTFDGQALSAKWALPQGAPKGVLVLLQGSGTVDLDGDVSSPFIGFGYRGASAKLSAQLAATLAESGIATLRFSKRGVDDRAQLPNQTMPYLVNDAKSAVAAARERFPAAKVGFLGFSEGSLLSVMAASELKVDVLFLMGLFSRHFSDVLAFQFVEWPVEMLRRKLDLNHDGILSAYELDLGEAWQLPLMGVSWQAADTDKSGDLSFEDEIIPAYEALLAKILVIAETEEFAAWYHSLLDLAPFKQYASKVSSPVFIYHGLDDTQLHWSWPAADRRYFAGKTTIRLFSGLGHCFSPLDGLIGETKTSGPLDPMFIKSLVSDVQRFFQ